MKLTNLKHIHNLMKDAKLYRGTFRYIYDAHPFECILLTDHSPFKLYLAPVGKHPFIIDLDVYPGYEINAYLSRDVYLQLLAYLEVKPGNAPKFQISKFFTHFNKKLTEIQNIKKTSYKQVLAANRNNPEIEEADKIYFMGWHPNQLDGINHVRPKNYAKTAYAFGNKFASIMKSYNISSRWTDIPECENLSSLEQYTIVPK